jgi:hypothetical protein
MTEDEKAELVCLMMHRRHQAGNRGKAATACTAGIRQSFACRLMGTAFLDAAVVGTARAECLMKPDELRQRRDSGESCSVKLPICHSVLVDVKARDWIGLTWCPAEDDIPGVYVRFRASRQDRRVHEERWLLL